MGFYSQRERRGKQGGVKRKEITKWMGWDGSYLRLWFGKGHLCFLILA